MAGTYGKALFYSLLLGLLAAIGAAVFLAIIYTVAGLWLSGHNRVLWGWNGSTVTGFDWPSLVFSVGTLGTGLLTAGLCYRALRPRGNRGHDH